MGSDPMGNLHLFWVGLCGDDHQPASREQVPMEQRTDVCYLKWDRLAGWHPVVNILRLSGRTSWMRTVADRQGRLHLIWRGDNCMNYSWSTLEAAFAPQIWIKHTRCLSDQISTSPAIAYDSLRNILYILYTESQGNVLVIRSEDNGQTWSRPFLVAEPRAAAGASAHAVYTGHPALAVDGAGVLHATWSSFPESVYPSLGVFYARSYDAGVTWSTAEELAGEHHTQANIVTYGDANLLVVWNGDAGTAGRYARRSSDGGITWQEREILLPPTVPGGMLGPPGLVIDGNGTAHVLMGSNDWIYYVHGSEFQQWSPPERLAVPTTYLDGAALVKFEEDPNETHTPNLVITQGNLLHATWSAVDTLMYAFRELDVPYEPPRPMLSLDTRLGSTATPRVTNAVATVASATAQMSVATQVPHSSVVLDNDHLNKSWLPIVVGVAPVALLLLVVLTLSSGRHR